MSKTYYQDLGNASSWPNIDDTLGLFGAGLDAIAARFMQAHGKFIYVSSIDGDDEYDGTAWDADADNSRGPVAKTATALDLCTANNGDVIVLMPGHSEAIGNETISIDVEGVSVIGIGLGDKQPQFVYNHANAKIEIAAENVYWQGIRHTASVTDIAIAIEIADAMNYCTVRKCKFDYDAAGVDEFLVSIRTNDATNNALIEDNYIDMGIGAAVSAISFTKDTDSTIVRGNTIMGDYSTACINGITTLSTKLLIEKNLLLNGLSGDIGTVAAIVLLTNSTGVIRDNDIMSNLSTMLGVVVADKCMLYRNYTSEVAGTETGTILGAANADD